MSAPAHGTTRRYRRGCHCTPCKTAIAEAARIRYRLKAYGTWQPYTPAAPVRDHVQAVIASGATYTEIARTAGVTPVVVKALLDGRDGRVPSANIRTEHAAALLRVRGRLEEFKPTAWVDATGTLRRLQALHTLGWHVVAIAAESGVHKSKLGEVLRGECRFISAAGALAVRGAYDRMWDRAPGVSDCHTARARNRAVRGGWAPPAAWGEDIDDPRAVPDLGGRAPRPLAVAEDVEFIRRTTGVEDRAAIAARLGLSRDTLDRNLERAKAWVRDREPVEV